MRLPNVLAAAMLSLAFVAAGCDVATEPGVPPVEEHFVFNADLEGWEPRAIDVIVGDEEIDWEITRTVERSAVGIASVRFQVDNRTDAAKVWIEQSFELQPNADYDVRIEFFFATADWSDVNLWRVIAGALPTAPETHDDLDRAFQDDTRAGAPPGAGFVWQRRSYDVPVRTGGDGLLHVVIGIWGTSEFERTYFVDDVRLVFRRL